MTRGDAAGLVSLVGAGPGDPGLLTLLGRERLRRADLVVYDRLINPALLQEVRPEAERVFVGKEAGAQAMPQAEIARSLIDGARAGKAVVRLKGGDPFVFGRGGEEAEALAAAGVPFEVVPGVGSAVCSACLCWDSGDPSRSRIVFRGRHRPRRCVEGRQRH